MDDLLKYNMHSQKVIQRTKRFKIRNAYFNFG